MQKGRHLSSSFYLSVAVRAEPIGSEGIFLLNMEEDWISCWSTCRLPISLSSYGATVADRHFPFYTMIFICCHSSCHIRSRIPSLLPFSAFPSRVKALRANGGFPKGLAESTCILWCPPKGYAPFGNGGISSTTTAFFYLYISSLVSSTNDYSPTSSVIWLLPSVVSTLANQPAFIERSDLITHYP